MNLTLRRLKYLPSGIFSEIAAPDGQTIAWGLEHAYLQADGSYAPKIPAGTYTCIRGMHRLASMKNDFETFEVTGVPGHTNILIHVGNFNADSSGCILVGEAIAAYKDGYCITNSKKTFAEFMELESGVDSFQLTAEA